MILETLNDLLGKRADQGLVDEIKETICCHENVNGAYDLILHNYGPEKIIGSVHIEIPDTMTMEELDRLERQITLEVYQKHGVTMAAIGIYTIDTDDEEAMRLREEITEIAMSHEGVLQLHGFHIYKEEKLIVFDLIIDYSLGDRDSLFKHISDEIAEKYPEYKVFINPDIDI